MNTETRFLNLQPTGIGEDTVHPGGNDRLVEAGTGQATCFPPEGDGTIPKEPQLDQAEGDTGDGKEPARSNTPSR